MDSYGPNDSSQFLAIYLSVFAAVFLFEFILIAIFYVVMAIALSTFFGKVGVERWIAWVPFYSTWKWLEIGGQKGWFALLSLIPYGGIVTAVFLYIGMYRTGIAFRKDAGFLVLGIFLPFVWAFILGGSQSVYEPERIAAAGYPPPLAGYGSAPHQQP
jgi:Family of unknown function (DUF5684)